jgi:hypothetical protein
MARTAKVAVILMERRGFLMDYIFRWDKWWDRYRWYCIPGIITLIGSFAGTIAWFGHYIATLANTPNQPQAISPIELAGVTATLGGLVLIGAFYKEKDEHANDEKKEHTKSLKLVGKLILFSSVCFMVTYFLLEYVRLNTSPVLSPLNWFFVITTDLAAIFAGFSLSFALSFLVTIIPFL